MVMRQLINVQFDFWNIYSDCKFMILDKSLLMKFEGFRFAGIKEIGY